MTLSFINLIGDDWESHVHVSMKFIDESLRPNKFCRGQTFASHFGDDCWRRMINIVVKLFVEGVWYISYTKDVYGIR